MIQILVGTDRLASRSAEVAKIVAGLYQELGTPTSIMRLEDLDLHKLNGRHYGEDKPEKIAKAISDLMLADGLVVIVPEYNGSYPGALKYFIDHWKYPESFEHRPVCFIGLGGKFGGLRPVEHLQQVFGYRNSFVFPERVFLQNIWSILKDGKILDETLMGLLTTQAQGFCRFIKALRSENLHGGDYKK